MTTLRIVEPRAESKLERRAWKIRDRACQLNLYSDRKSTTAEAARLARIEAARLMEVSSRALRCCGYDEFA